jgi:serine/threonine protein kinase
MLDKNYNIRVIAFGFSKSFQSDYSLFSTTCGSPSYVAPEIISSQYYDIKCDIWSSGIILYEMICGKLPFDNQNRNLLFKQIQNCEPDYDKNSEDISKLIQDLLKKNPDDRISLSKIKNHSCLLSSDYNQLLTTTLERIRTFDEDSFINNDFDDEFLDKHDLIKNKILMKEKITDFLKILNRINYERHQFPVNRSQTMNQIDFSRQKIPQRFTEPAHYKLQEKNSLSLRANKSIPHICKNRRQIIQRTIFDAHHIPILDSAKTGRSVK